MATGAGAWLEAMRAKRSGAKPSAVRQPIVCISWWDVHLGVATRSNEAPHDERALETALAYAKSVQPDAFIIGGDFLDAESCSQHGGKADSPWLIDELAFASEWLSRIRSALPEADIYYLEGNHETRLQRFIAKNAPTLSGLFAIPEALGLSDMDVAWVPYMDLVQLQMPSGTPGAIHYFHGHCFNKHHAATNAATYMRSVRYGHTHRPQMYTLRPFGSSPIVAVGSPCLARLQPDYMAQPSNHVQGFGVDTYDPESGLCHSENVLMDRGRFFRDGRMWGA